MIKVNITKQSNYPVKTPVIKKKLVKFFEDHGIVSDAEVSIALVNEKKMMEIGNKYLKDKKLHNVLSFVASETKVNFVYPDNGVMDLGSIVVCYPVAVKEAIDENILVEERVYTLIEHGALHLMGVHHE